MKLSIPLKEAVIIATDKVEWGSCIHVRSNHKVIELTNGPGCALIVWAMFLLTCDEKLDSDNVTGSGPLDDHEA